MNNKITTNRVAPACPINISIETLCVLDLQNVSQHLERELLDKNSTMNPPLIPSPPM